MQQYFDPIDQKVVNDVIIWPFQPANLSAHRYIITEAVK